MTLAGSLEAETTKRGYVFSESFWDVVHFNDHVTAHDMEGAMRMIKEGKVHPLKEGLNVEIVEIPAGGGMVKIRPSGSKPDFSWTRKGVWTVLKAIQ